MAMNQADLDTVISLLSGLSEQEALDALDTMHHDDIRSHAGRESDHLVQIYERVTGAECDDHPTQIMREIVDEILNTD